MTYWKTQDFKALQQAWYGRLKAEGFQDAEEVIAGELLLKQVAAHPYRGADDLTRSTKEDYFRVMAQAVQDAEFDSEVDRLILTAYAEGKKIKAICDELAGMGQTRGRATVRYKVRLYEMRWGMREYSPRELNLWNGRRRMPPKKKLDIAEPYVVGENAHLYVRESTPAPEPAQIRITMTGGIEVHGLRVQDVIVILKEMGARAA